MAHSYRYAFEGVKRLAEDTGVSLSTMKRLLRGETNPSYRLIQSITAALSADLGTRLDPRELFSSDGTYPTPSACALCACGGCMPEEAWDARGNLRPEYRDMKPSTWSLYPAASSPVSTPSPSMPGVSPQGNPVTDAAGLRAALRQRLLDLNFHAFARCLAHLLGKLGYEDVGLAGRTDWKGRNQDGGYDLTATLPPGSLPRRVVVSLKQFDPPMRVYQRSVDELRGTCLRVGAAEAVLITTSSFSPAIRKEALQSAPLAPVRLMDGEELLDLLVAQGIGVRQEAAESANGPARLGVDHAFFEGLSRVSSGNGRNDCSGAPEWTVTVAVGPVPRRRPRRRGVTHAA
jgi:hypothetical protein